LRRAELGLLLVTGVVFAAGCSGGNGLTEPDGSEFGPQFAQPRFTHVEPVFVADNPTCSDLVPGTFELKVEPVSDGTFSDGTLTVTVDVRDTNDGQVFDWTSNIGVDAVFAKGGPNGNLYLYDPEATSDTGLHAPANDSGQWAGLSHISFCYDLNLDVSKTAETSLTRTWEWTIDKSADQTDLLLSEGQLFQVNYQVEVDATSQDSDWKVEGTITIENNTPFDATITGVTDVVSPAIAADVDCGVTFPHVLEDGDTLECSYEADLPDGADRTNTATVTTSGLIGGGEATADVDFENATVDEVDECIDVSDTNINGLGTVCAGVDDLPYTFTYSLGFGKHPDADVQLECGDNEHTNTASFETNDTGATGDDDWTVNANVRCEEDGDGCTLTPGYWKTHSQQGPAPYDDTWALLGPAQENTVFFLSGQTYYQALWTAPGGNAYYILAHAYIAAELNQLNGASIPNDVLTAFNQATTLFNTYTPAQIGALRGNNATRKQFIALAKVLDEYNNGLTGPGHCSE
jgi:hypothetical protein